MLNLPPTVAALLMVFGPLFSKRVWQSAQVLLVGAISAPGKRTVSAILQVMGLSEAKNFQIYHRVLSRACWSSRAVSGRLGRLFRLLTNVFVAVGPILLGIDDTLDVAKEPRLNPKVSIEMQCAPAKHKSLKPMG